jgi:hypothetical protein
LFLIGWLYMVDIGWKGAGVLFWPNLVAGTARCSRLTLTRCSPAPPPPLTNLLTSQGKTGRERTGEGKQTGQCELKVEEQEEKKDTVQPQDRAEQEEMDTVQTKDRRTEKERKWGKSQSNYRTEEQEERKWRKDTVQLHDRGTEREEEERHSLTPGQRNRRETGRKVTVQLQDWGTGREDVRKDTVERFQKFPNCRENKNHQSKKSLCSYRMLRLYCEKKGSNGSNVTIPTSISMYKGFFWTEWYFTAVGIMLLVVRMRK